ncbi:MAG: propanediol/glycerol family dehydratase medium subunit [Pseudomonadota bacterium]
MGISEDILRQIIVEVLQQMQGSEKTAASRTDDSPVIGFADVGPARPGNNRHEVVIGLPPAFGVSTTKTIINIPHRDVLREVMAGIEEEGLSARLIKVHRTADVGFIAHEAAKLSGSGIGVGIISRGTTVIHQKDLAPLQNLELFSQSPLVELETFRAIGRNAAKYAKGESPTPVPVRNDPMVRPSFQGLAALLHNKEVQFVHPDGVSMEVRAEL